MIQFPKLSGRNNHFRCSSETKRNKQPRRPATNGHTYEYLYVVCIKYRARGEMHYYSYNIIHFFSTLPLRLLLLAAPAASSPSSSPLVYLFIYYCKPPSATIKIRAENNENANHNKTNKTLMCKNNKKRSALINVEIKTSTGRTLQNGKKHNINITCIAEVYIGTVFQKLNIIFFAVVPVQFGPATC